MNWHAPLDQGCETVAAFMEGADDPMMQHSGCWGEVLEGFEKKHRHECKRCQAFGVANMEVE
jgi:hypothetical protein